MAKPHETTWLQEWSILDNPTTLVFVSNIDWVDHLPKVALLQLLRGKPPAMTVSLLTAR